MRFRKKPVVIDAVQLTENNIAEAYRFIHGEDSIKLTCMMAHDYWERYEDMVKREGLKLKTPESGDGTQIASIGDYIVRGESKDLGVHYWPVKPDYFEENYEKAE